MKKNAVTPYMNADLLVIDRSSASRQDPYACASVDARGRGGIVASTVAI
jgi:hypothetical protein